MKSKMAAYLLSVTALFLLCGCASIKEGANGFLGVSTKVLEEGRKNAISKDCAYSRQECYDMVKKELVKGGSYVYKEDKSRDMLALYVSENDTTPVGIFFKEVDASKTQLEVSSPSKYAKELIAKAVFSVLEKTATKGKEGASDAKK